MAARVRFGIGYDIHRLVSDRDLVLGGVRIDHDRGLLGHSDGDAVLHALIDALLGAAGLGDVGEMFPDTDSAYKNVDSRSLVTDALARVRSAGFVPGNVDLIIHAERPNLSPYKAQMTESIAGLLGVAVDAVNVKAKTNEGLGPVGRREGIACTVVATLIPA